MYMRQNPWRYNAPPGWSDISTAPKDGTVIEIQNNWGVAPHFDVCTWNDGWKSVSNPNTGMIDGPHLSWRPYAGSVDSYVDPTGGAQMTNAYWLHACGRPDLAIKAGGSRLDDNVPSEPELTTPRAAGHHGMYAFAIILIVGLVLTIVAT